MWGLLLAVLIVGLGGGAEMATPVLQHSAMARAIGERTVVEIPADGAAAEPQPSPSTDSSRVARADPRPIPTPEPPALPIPVSVPRDFTGLTEQVDGAAQASGAVVGVALVELGGKDAASWSYFGDAQFGAASTYKLPLLMAEAQGIADGSLSGSDQLCYQDEDYQDGYYQDYVTGACYARDFLASRAAQQSDNTAAHILVRYLGGADVLNAYARAHGAQQSSFFDANVTTANDLARLWVSEASGAAGGAAAQAWLYPLLQNTAYEAGIGAGLSGATVVHKVGMIDDVVNDAGLVLSGPRGPYVLIVCTAGVGGDQAWSLIAQISSQVGQAQAARGA